jgi:SAM-dependent methyltransferase
MTEIANIEQYEAWNGDQGQRWVANAKRQDEVLAPVGEVVLAVAAPTAGERVFDVGCGCGATTLAAATLVGDRGSALGLDLSGPMLEVARRRAATADIGNATFIQGDAQTHAVEPQGVDLAISRFGTMFFTRPSDAFTNIASALRPDGRLCIATWEPLDANEWLAVPGAALLKHTSLPDDVTEGPGMFAQSEPGLIYETLRDAGFTDIDVQAHTLTLTLGATIDDAIGQLERTGAARRLLETMPDERTRDAAFDDVREALIPFQTERGVQLEAGVLLTTARTLNH